jgi:hypothetical protein
MPFTIPFVTSRNNYRLNVAIGGKPFMFDNVHWNVRDSAWYFDLRDGDETLILAGYKLVLGSTLGQSSTHVFFAENLLSLVDSSGSGTEAGYDDLGDRIQLVVTTSTDIFAPLG